ncbi:MAG: GNAT family N-acetyltransferase [Prevotellaceae bacterium]|jgi:ribosomal protein S18 acetylase RimI-like enzyme|nr:GNAT family N-acetyltransferase [Prevotellaceae bacterium]
MTKIIPASFCETAHLEAVAALINAYIADEMGGGNSTDLKPLSKIRQLMLVDGLGNHPKAIVLLAQNAEEFVGLLVAFENFSTFTAQPMLNIHDLIVLKEHRGQGIGKLLMNALIEEAENRHCSRITLEVRTDNQKAQTLYKSLGFEAPDPNMLYWRKYI